MTPVTTQPTSAIVAQPIATPIAALLKRPLVLGLLLVVATFGLYYPVHGHPFINYDDRDYVYENPQVKSGITWQTVKWAFTTSAARNWHPVTWLSHELDYELFGLNPAGHHDVNVVFHAVNAVLLFWLLLRATGFAGRSFMVAALFALHPINVESVAWVAERKNLISMMFFLLVLIAYRWYATRPRVGRYALVALLFALGLMAKPQIITLPFVLLLWDYWPLQRMFQRQADSPGGANPVLTVPARSLPWLVLEKIPLLAISAASAVVTLSVQYMTHLWYPRSVRVGNAILSYGLYVKKAVWPAPLAVLYPHPDHPNWGQVLLAAVVLLAITVLVIVGRRHRYLPVGWFWFLGTLVPMLGFVQVGYQAMADRYVYAALIGLFIIACWGLAEGSESIHCPANLLPGAGVAALLFLAVLTRHQLDYWQSDEALWTHAVQVTQDNWVAESQLGTALAIDGKVDEAMPHFYRTLAIEPYNADANMGIAIYQLQRRNYREAIVYYRRVVTGDNAPRPGIITNAWLGMAKAYFALGDTAKAQECVEAAKQRNGFVE